MSQPAPDHTDLIARCLQYEPAAQRSLYQLFAPRMLMVCARYTRTQAEAEDVLQEVFIKVFKSLKDFRQDGPLEAWIRRIVVTTALNNYRREKAHQQLHLNEEAAAELASHEASALEQLTTQEILELIRHLPDGCRLVLNLYAIEGYSHKEIGLMLGIQESASKSQLCKARQMLVRMIEKLEKSTRHARAT